jgi:hypothetical protein
MLDTNEEQNKGYGKYFAHANSLIYSLCFKHVGFVSEVQNYVRD